MRQRDRDPIGLAADESLRHAVEDQTARPRVRSGVKVTGITRLLVAPAREARRSTVGIAVGSDRLKDRLKRVAGGGGATRRDRQDDGRGEAQHDRNTHRAFCSAMRPTLLASVPNHIMRVLLSKYMWRMVPLTSMLAKNFSVFGSNPMSRFAGPVSVNQMRP